MKPTKPTQQSWEVRTHMPHRARDRGSATIYAALLTGLLTALTGAFLALGAAILARHRAGAAADLAALSAAVHAEAGEVPCDWARRVAAAQRARLLRCTCDGPVCLVRTAVGTPWGAATVTSRAGPADDAIGLGAAGVERSRRVEAEATVPYAATGSGHTSPIAVFHGSFRAEAIAAPRATTEASAISRVNDF